MTNTEQTVTDLRIRGLQARKTLEALGVSGGYMGLIELQATKEGRQLDRDDRVRCRQLLNGNLYLKDVPLLELTERAIAAQQALYGEGATAKTA